MKKTALVTGYTGQDGTFLTQYLLSLGYIVVALCRRVSTEPPHRVRGFDFTEQIQTGQLILVQGDLLSRKSLDTIIAKYLPGEIYNLAAQSHVHTSFGQPEFTIEADFLGVVNLLEALESAQHLYDLAGHDWRLYQASTSEMYGHTGGAMNEDSNFNPISPYAIAKSAAHYYCRMKRGQGKFVANGILFNHESEIRGGDFVTQKIVAGVVNFVQNGRSFELGNLESVRDWGYAKDYVMAMHMMLQHDKADEFVIGTGHTHTIRDFLQAAVVASGQFTGQAILWEGSGLNEVGKLNGRPIVTISKEFYRPNDVTYLEADATKARTELGWSPITSFETMVQAMYDNEARRQQ